MTIVKDKAFYRNILSIAVPLAMQNLLTFAINIADTLMLAKADNTGILLSASNLANQPFFLLSMFVFGLASAGSVLASQYWGKKNLEAVRLVISMVTKLCFFFGVLFSLAVLIFPYEVMAIYTPDKEIAEAGVKYLSVMGYAYIFFSISSALLCSLRYVEVVKISVVVNLVSFFTNVFLNWVLIFGNLGAPAMGITGAAIATFFARLLEFIIVIIFVLLVDKTLRFKVRDLLKWDKTLFFDYLRHGSPVVINEVMWSIGITLQAVILGHIEYSAGNPVAANSVASNVQQLATIFIFGVANSATVLIGKAIGEGNLEKAQQQASTYRVIALIMGICAGLIVLLLRGYIVDYFELEPATMQLALDLLIVIAINLLFVSFSSIYIVGIFRGAGDTKFCLFAEMFSLWVVALPLAAIMANVLHLPVPIVLFGMRFDEVLKTILCLWRSRGNKWIKQVARDENFALKTAE